MCISVVPPTTILHARYLSAKLRKNFPDLKIVVGLWGHTGNVAEASQLLSDSGADEVVTTVAEAIERVADHAPALVAAAETEQGHE